MNRSPATAPFIPQEAVDKLVVQILESQADRKLPEESIVAAVEELTDMYITAAALDMWHRGEITFGWRDGQLTWGLTR